MKRILLNLLLILTLSTNAVAASWMGTAMSMRAASEVHVDATEATQVLKARTDCHDRTSATTAADESAGQVAAETARKQPPTACCGGADCQCGGLVPTVLTQLSLSVPVPGWRNPPQSQPAIRAIFRRALPPFRPPAT